LSFKDIFLISHSVGNRAW